MAIQEECVPIEEDGQERSLPLKHGTTVKLENNNESYTYKLELVLPDNNLVCKSISKAISEGFAVGSMVNLISPTGSGSCVTPVQITAISYQAELVALKVMGKSQHVQRRMFARIKTGAGVQLKLQIDNHTSRYKSLEISDISIGGVGVVIYSKNPIATGQLARLDVQLPVVGGNNRLAARGQIVHCSPKSGNRMAYLLGIKFTELCDADHKKIVEYISGLQEKADKNSPCECFEYKEDKAPASDSDSAPDSDSESENETPQEIAS
ncbi:MAG: PilZ domain-containing protein [Rubrobacteridae bacterium]|nr:PilZ domain-containing protein [Rubrobacteridae bacterium]